MAQGDNMFQQSLINALAVQRKVYYMFGRVACQEFLLVDCADILLVDCAHFLHVDCEYYVF